MTKHNNQYAPKKIWKQTRNRLIITFILSILLSLAVSLVVLFAFQPQDLTTHGVDWDVVSGFVGLITVALTAGGAFFIGSEYINRGVIRQREQTEAALSIYTTLYERLMNDEDIAARRWIITQIDPLPENATEQEKESWLANFTDTVHNSPTVKDSNLPIGHAYLKRILNTLDFIGFVDRHYWDMEQELVDWMSAPVAKVWERIEPYVEQEARLRQEDDFYCDAKYFGIKCVQHRQEKNYPSSKIIEHGT